MSVAQMTNRTAVANPNWAQLPLFDRSKWETVRFGDVVELVSDTSRNPEAEGITRYIGLEHLEPGSLHIKTWGELVDGVTFTKRCRRGQVLFGKRRAYQRKVAIAEFEALVSGDIYVFQAKEELLDPKLLPFICMSERFFQFAVETSAGSLSPRTNWSHLKDFEFALPPLDQQRRSAELLWAVDDVLEQQKAMISALENAEKGYLKDALSINDADATTLDDISEFITSGPRGWAEYYSADGPLFIRSQNIRNQVLDWSDTQRVRPPAGAEGNRTRTQAGDMVITATGNSVGNVAYIPEGLEEAYVSQHVALVRLHEPSLYRLLVAFFGPNGPGNEQILGAQYGQAKPGLSLIGIRKFIVPGLSNEEKEAITNKILDFDSTKEALTKAIEDSQNLVREISNQMTSNQ